MRIREKNFLTWFIFQNNGDAMGLRAFTSALPALIFTLCMTAGPLYYSPAIFIPLSLLFVLSWSIGGGYLSRLHPLYGVRDNYSTAFRTIGERYLRLDQSDRALFPAGILATLRDDDLDSGERYEVAMSMKRVLDDIQERETAKARLERDLRKKGKSVAHITAALEDSRKSVQAETSVWVDELSKMESEKSYA